MQRNQGQIVPADELKSIFGFVLCAGFGKRTSLAPEKMLSLLWSEPDAATAV